MKFLLILVFSSVYLFSSNAFISPHELREMITKKNVVLIDTTDEKTFNAGHIPSAQRADISDFRKQVGPYQLMKSSADIQKVARSLGINNDSKVVFYGHDKHKELLKASYMALAFVANGLKHVSILNGTYEGWLFEYEDFISKAKNEKKQGNFTAKYNPNILVDLEYVKKNIGKVPMIEARPIRYYNAEAQSSGVRRLGHIAKAQSSAWSNKFKPNKTIKPNQELEKIYLGTNNLKPEKEVITYCTGGLEASMNWYILDQHLNFKDVKLYDASMREWGNRDDTPMEK
ncbi:MAG: rhodanese-like domain-containing protein [Sulfurimonas sp.]